MARKEERFKTLLDTVLQQQSQPTDDGGKIKDPEVMEIEKARGPAEFNAWAMRWESY